MKTYQTIAYFALIMLLMSLLSLTTQAQKLPTVQQSSVWAPANVKVDARLDDWGNTLQAYNRVVDVYYTIANDHDNLYLVIKSTHQTINNKILGGGIDVVINTEGKKKASDAFIVTFPLVDLANLRSQVMQFARGMRGPQTLDSSAIATMRKKAVTMAKEIKLVGFKNIPDSVISIYNEYGLKAFTDFDNQGNLVMEMAIPLKYLNLSGGAAFTYNIKLNGIQINKLFPGAGGGAFGGGAPGGSFGAAGGFRAGDGTPPAGNNTMPSGMADIESMISSTDFWGKYTLAIK